MKTFRKFMEACEPINEAEYNKEWWDSKSDSFKQRYIERHPNSIYAQKANMTDKQKKDVTNFVDKAFGKNSQAAKTTRDNLSDKVSTSSYKDNFKEKLSSIKDPKLKRNIEYNLIPSEDNDARTVGGHTRKDMETINKALKNGFHGMNLDKYIDRKTKLKKLYDKGLISNYEYIEGALSRSNRWPEESKERLDWVDKITSSEFDDKPIELSKDGKIFGTFRNREEMLRYIEKNSDKVDLYDLNLRVKLKNKDGDVLYNTIPTSL